MADEPTPAPKKRTRSAQDQKAANTLNTRRTGLVAVIGSPDALALLGPRGFDKPGLSEGLTMADTLQAAFNDRQLAVDTADVAAVKLAVTDAAARTGFKDFRKVANGVFKTNETARTTLNLAGRISDDRQKFMTAADTVYAAALSRSTYLTALSKRGYTEATLQAERAKLAALTTAEAAFKLADEAATRATAQRKAAAKAFDTWWAEFTATASVALKDRPDLLGLLGL